MRPLADDVHRRAAALSCRRCCVAGCNGEPIFNRLFGVALSYFIITLPAFPEPYTDGIFIDAPLLVCFIFQTVALLVTLAAGMLDKFRIRSWLGWVRSPTKAPFDSVLAWRVRQTELCQSVLPISPAPFSSVGLE